MKKNLLLVGALVSAFLLASCSGGDKSKAPVVSTADIENAAEVIKYYNTSLGVLKDMVKEKDVNAVLDYMEQKGKAPALSAIVPPAVVSKDSAIVLNPGNCFNEETRQNLKQNYTGLFQARTEFYANFDTYLSYLKKKDTHSLHFRCLILRLLTTLNHGFVIFCDTLRGFLGKRQIPSTPYKSSISATFNHLLLVNHLKNVEL